MSSPAASVHRRSRLGRAVALGAVALAGAAGVVAVSAPASAAFSAVELVNGHSSSCLDVRGGVSTVGTAVQITTCNGGAGQRYTTTTAGEIRVTIGGVARCLDTTAAGTANGTRIVIAACSGAASQRWTQTATNALSHPTSGRCVDIFASAVTSGTPAVLWDCKNGGNGSQTWMPTAPGTTTPPPPPPPPAPGGKHAWPYIDITIPNPSMASVAAATGQRFFTTAFIIGSAAGCAPTWGGTIPLTDSRIVGDINAVKAQGGDVTVAFGGAVGPYLEHLCATQAALAAAYERVIDTLHITHIDVDVEAAVNIDLMTKALAQVQRERGVTVTFTLLLQADTFGLNPALGTGVLTSAKANGLNVNTVNPMTMDYGLSVPDFGDSVILAAGSVLTQLAQIYPEKSDAQRKAMLGLTPMIGRNDTGPVFQIQDAQQVVSYANTNHIASVAFWSVGRDNGGCPGGGVSPTCSSIAQSTFQFTNIFKGFVG
ncbi:MAG: chitinase [Micromonosporaceae bacterium]|nr:chitinase [Micromonosporaceae bacterium]